MRKALKEINEVRQTFVGTFVRFGVKNGYKGTVETVLLKDIRLPDGRCLADHLWFNLTKQFHALHLEEGDIVRFDARVKKYQKGYKGRRDDVYIPIETDYKLSYPTKVKKLVREKAAAVAVGIR